ncbi:hypothetical protein BaRGS_00033775, partial [Batillaria attramentaria]
VSQCCESQVGLWLSGSANSAKESPESSIAPRDQPQQTVSYTTEHPNSVPASPLETVPRHRLKQQFLTREPSAKTTSVKKRVKELLKANYRLTTLPVPDSGPRHKGHPPLQCFRNHISMQPYPRGLRRGQRERQRPPESPHEIQDGRSQRGTKKPHQGVKPGEKTALIERQFDIGERKLPRNEMAWIHTETLDLSNQTIQRVNAFLEAFSKPKADRKGHP